MGLIALFKETPRPFLAALGLGVTVFSSETDVMTLVSSLEEVDVAGSGFLFAALILGVASLVYLRHPSFDSPITTSE